jgi:hypothetical protein
VPERGLTIIDALRDPNLLGVGPFADLSTWERSIVQLKAIYGLKLSAPERAWFEQHTGRQYDPPPGGWPAVVSVDPRQTGKTQRGAALVAFESLIAPPDSGETWCILIAQDLRSAQRTAYSRVCALYEASPVLQRMITKKTADTLFLKNGQRVSIYPCRPESVRGLRARIVVLDEFAFFRGSDARPVDTEMLRAAWPTLATTNGRLVILSTPWGQNGKLWELYRQHYGRADSDTLVWHGTLEMNPLLSSAYAARMRETDPEGARAEIDAEFLTSLTALLESEAIEACRIPGRRELPPVAGRRYEGFVDVCGGRHDEYVVGIAHKDGGKAIVDVVRAWRPPLNPAATTAEAAELLKTYGMHCVQGDRYAASWPVEQFAANGIRYEPASKDRSALYLDLVGFVNSARVEIPDDDTLLRQLRTLERRRGSSGRDRVDHPRGGHDDRANVLAGVAGKLLAQPTRWGFDELFAGELDEKGNFPDDDDEYVYDTPRRGLT